MTGLGETVRALATLRGVRKSVIANLAEPVRLKLVAQTSSNPGNLRMLTYVPPGLPPGAPLVVVLHGCAQNAAAYDHGSGWSQLAQRHGFALLFPEQERSNNTNLCFNWFQRGDVTRGAGEVHSISEMVIQVVKLYALDARRVYVTGLSAGGAMAAAMLATYPEVFAGGAIIAGLPFGAADGVQQAFEAMSWVRQHSAQEWGDRVRGASPLAGPWPQVQVWHGDADTTVKCGNAEESLKQWANVHGVDERADTDQVGGAIHRAWRGPAGNIVLESYAIAGLGHGVPLNLGADDLDQSLGVTGPFMLEAGISSTWRIARSWGLLTQAARPRRIAAPHRPVAPAFKLPLSSVT